MDQITEAVRESRRGKKPRRQEKKQRWRKRHAGALGCTGGFSVGPLGLPESLESIRWWCGGDWDQPGVQPGPKLHSVSPLKKLDKNGKIYEIWFLIYLENQIHPKISKTTETHILMSFSFLRFSPQIIIILYVGTHLPSYFLSPLPLNFLPI